MNRINGHEKLMEIFSHVQMAIVKEQKNIDSDDKKTIATNRNH